MEFIIIGLLHYYMRDTPLSHMFETEYMTGLLVPTTIQHNKQVFICCEYHSDFVYSREHWTYLLDSTFIEPYNQELVIMYILHY